jgi:uncharacterized membrane protein
VVLTGCALIVIITLLLLAPKSLLDKADRAAYAVCHQIPDRTFTIAGRQLPLCARCSGTYLGALAGLIVLGLVGKGRAGRFPTRPYLAVLGVFMLVWAADGLNSFLALLDLPHLYEPSNYLRLITGAFEGIVIAAILLPALNVTLWRRPAAMPSITSVSDLLWLVVGAGVIVGLVAVEPDWLLYPLALLSGAMVPVLLGALNAMLYLAFRRREGIATQWRDAVSPLILGLALALCEIALIGAGRDALTAAYGLPF